MKQILIIFLTTLIPVITLGQESISDYRKLTETDSLYLTAVKKFIVEIDSFYNKYSQEKWPKTIFIQYENYLSNIPNTVDGYKIQFIGPGNQKKIFRQNDNHLRLTKISSLTLKDGQFRITLTPYYGEIKKRKHLYLSLSDWTVISFDFKNGHLTYRETKNGGI